MPKIKVTIDRKGRVTIETEGFSGPACKRATKNLEDALGGAKSEDYTREYYEPDVEVDQEVHRG